VDEWQDSSNEIEQQLQTLSERSEQLFLDCKLRSALRISREITHTARAHGRLPQYLYGLFDQMRFGHGLLDPKMTREAAVELVLLLQDEEQARRLQPDLNDATYHWICNWMSSCAYDNLAEATGLMSGYNSAGMHECISEGIQVCRQTGKLECIKCFREYAADVYLAGDDLDMVRHQCQTLLEFREENEEQDRRWSAHQHLAWVNLLEGRLGKSEDAYLKAIELAQAEKVYQKTRSSYLARVALEEVRLLIGRSKSSPDLEMQAGFDLSEWPKLELDLARLDALRSVLTEDYEQAIEILSEWDRRLTEQSCLKEWFEVRLRLIAVYLLMGKHPRALALSKGLEAKAQEALDHLTLRRLKRLMAPDAIVCPIPTLTPPDCGPYGRLRSDAPEADTSDTPESPDDSESPDDPAETDIIESPSPLAGMLTDYMQQIMAAGDDESARRAILDSLLGHAPEDVQEAGDAAYLVHLSRFVATGTEDALRIWDWACRMRTQFVEDAVMQSVVASLGHFFRSADAETFHDRISLADLERGIRLSLSLNPNHPRNFARAGAFFLEEGLAGDAEQCFARAFRLDRTDGTVAHQLADLYRETDRPRDALAVLDICLRKGTSDENVAWEAAMTALQLSQYDMLLTYLNRYQELAEKEQVWLHYYRGLANYHLGRYEECLLELDEELQFKPPGLLHLHVIRLSALDRLGQDAEAREELQKLLNLRFSEVGYLSLHGLVRLAETICETIGSWPEDDPLRQQAALRLMRAGLISDDYLQLSSSQEEKEPVPVQFYRVQLLQPLDDGWPSSEGCLAGQQDWQGYVIDWGVLAEDEESAVKQVLALQTTCEAVTPQVVEVVAGEETFRAQPGVVWQGYRRDERELPAEQ